MSVDDEQLFAQALVEYETQSYPKGLWAKAFAEATGNESHAKAIFLRLRVEQLKSIVLTDAGLPNTYQFAMWPRYFARVLDGLILGSLMYCLLWNLRLLLFPLQSIVSLTLWDSVTYWLSLSCCILAVEPVFIAFLGGTPAKLLLGICVTKKDGSRLNLGEAFVRSVNVYFKGCFCAIPLLCLIPWFFWYFRLSRRNIPSWDKGDSDCKYIVHNERFTWLRLVFVFFLAMALQNSMQSVVIANLSEAITRIKTNSSSAVIQGTINNMPVEIAPTQCKTKPLSYYVAQTFDEFKRSEGWQELTYDEQQLVAKQVAEYIKQEGESGCATTEMRISSP